MDRQLSKEHILEHNDAYQIFGNSQVVVVDLVSLVGEGVVDPPD